MKMTGFLATLETTRPSGVWGKYGVGGGFAAAHPLIKKPTIFQSQRSNESRSRISSVINL